MPSALRVERSRVDCRRWPKCRWPPCPRTAAGSYTAVRRRRSSCRSRRRADRSTHAESVAADEVSLASMAAAPPIRFMVLVMREASVLVLKLPLSSIERGPVLEQRVAEPGRDLRRVVGRVTALGERLFQDLFQCAGNRRPTSNCVEKSPPNSVPTSTPTRVRSNSFLS